MWLGLHGAITTSGVGQLLKARAVQAGIGRALIHPHVFRHTFAHEWKLEGGLEGDLMTIGGWRSPTVVHRYAQSAAGSRAKEAHASSVRRNRIA